MADVAFAAAAGLAAGPAFDAAGLHGGSSNPNVARIAIDQRKKKMEVVFPEVIGEKLLIKGVEEPVRPDGKLWKPIDFPQVTSLRLSFNNIIEISNLNNFDALTTLRLDNNIIDKITNLDHLTQLTWLDLSFNNIREIEGLDKLSNLQDLSLYHNHIEEIKGIAPCPKLNVLSLGHNQIKDLKHIDGLRRFPNLRCVCLDGNKVCENDAYTQHVCAYLPTLKYLDKRLVDRTAVAQAQESYHLDELVEVRDKEMVEAAKANAKKEKDVTIERLKASFLDCTEDLFEDMCSQRTEPEHVTILQCYAQLKEDYRDKWGDEIKNLRLWMEEKNGSLTKKVGAFERAITGAEKEGEDGAFQMIREFQSLKKKVVMQAELDMVHQLLDQLAGLESHLMANEIQQQECIEEAISEFEARVCEVVQGMSEKGSDFFRRLEELERIFFTGLVEGANSEMDSFQQQSELNLSDDTNKARLLANREEMHQACANFNEAHMSLIQSKDDYLQNQMTSWRTSFFERHRERQYQRNRQRMMDIKTIADECREEIDSAGGDGADYDDELENGCHDVVH